MREIKKVDASLKKKSMQVLNEEWGEADGDPREAAQDEESA
jgi:hypothetical protein